MKKLIAILLLAATLMLSSCGYPFVRKSIFPEGYTGGFGIEYGSGQEIYWVETYEECVEAMDQLKSHGSTFYKTAIFSYEGEEFDTKYCFQFYHKKDNVKYGDNPYDRWAEQVEVSSFAFFEDVTIEELVYSDIDDYLWSMCYEPSSFDYLCEKYSNIPSLPFQYRFLEEKNHHALYYKGDYFVIFGAPSEVEQTFSKECGEAVINSIVFIGFDE